MNIILTESKEETAGPLEVTRILCYMDEQTPVEHGALRFQKQEVHSEVHLIFVKISLKSLPQALHPIFPAFPCNKAICC